MEMNLTRGRLQSVQFEYEEAGSGFMGNKIPLVKGAAWCGGSQ